MHINDTSLAVRALTSLFPVEKLDFTNYNYSTRTVLRSHVNDATHILAASVRTRVLCASR